MNFKTILLVITGFGCLQFANAQLNAAPVCPAFTVDVLDGTINEKLDCSSTAGEVKKYFPCFTDAVEETGGAGCGGVFFKDRGISFFTERDYIEINENFKGKLIPSLLGVSRSSLFTMLGNPQLKDPNWDAFATKYGILILYYNKAGKVNKLQVSIKNTATIKLCD
jgi:hypothetical protein